MPQARRQQSQAGALVPGDHQHHRDQEALVVCNASAATTTFAGAVGSAAAAEGLGWWALLLAFPGFCPPRVSQSVLLQMHRCVALTGILVSWAEGTF